MSSSLSNYVPSPSHSSLSFSQNCSHSASVSIVAILHSPQKNTRNHPKMAFPLFLLFFSFVHNFQFDCSWADPILIKNTHHHLNRREMNSLKKGLLIGYHYIIICTCILIHCRNQLRWIFFSSESF
jgi:hypothetical protein